VKEDPLPVSKSMLGFGGVDLDVDVVPGQCMPSIIQTLHWLIDPVGFTRFCVRKYGDPFRIDVFGWGRLVMLSGPEKVRAIMVTPEDRLSGAQANKILEPVVGSNSVFVVTGVEHQVARKDLKPILSPSAFRNHFKTVRGSANKTFARMSQRPHDSQQFLREFTMETMLHVVFGVSDRNDVCRVTRTLEPVIGTLSSLIAFVPALGRDFGPFSPGAIIRRRIQKLSEVIHELIRISGSNTNCLAGQMTAAFKSNVSAREESAIRDQCVSVLVAGYDTTSAAISWALYWLAQEPDTQERLINEIREAFTGRDDDFEVIQSNEVLHAFCLEVLRMSPPVDFYPRQIMDPNRAKKKPVLLAPCSLMMHSSETQFAEAKSFKLDRFLEKSYSPNEFSPYGGGRRRCPGAELSLLMMKTIIAQILRKAHIEAGPQLSGTPQRRNVILVPRNLDLRFRHSTDVNWID